MVVTEGDPAEPSVTHSEQRKGALYMCSYEEEVEAMMMATEWIANHCQTSHNVTICTDSQSLCLALQSFNQETDNIRANLKDHEGAITIQWIPGHSGIPGNDLADAEAKNAADLMAPGRAISYRSACMQIWRTFQDETTHKTIKEVYSKYDTNKEKTITLRKDQVC